MANKAAIYVRFTSLPTDGGDYISFYMSGGYGIFEAPRTVRNSSAYYTIGSTLDACLPYLGSAINADYGIRVQATVVSIDSVFWLKIEAIEWGVVFTADNIPAYLTYNIVAEVPEPPQYNITSHSFSEADTDKNNKVKVTVTTENGTAPELFYVPGESILGVSSPFDINRQSINQALRDGYGIDSLSEQTPNYNIPSVLKYSITAGVLVSVSGATITIQKVSEGSGVEAGPFQYSLDGVNYDSSPVFYGILAGSYTAYMTDGYGGLYTYDFEVPELLAQKPEPYFNIERANPLRFVNTASATYRNFDNTLFNEQNIPNVDKRFFRQPFQLTDIPKTQIKTNYETLSVNIYDCAGEVVDTITPDLKIENLNQKDKRDCYIKTGGEGYTNIFFFQGNTYDPITGDVNGEYFEGTGRLPYFCQVGMLIELTSTNLNGLFEVTGIVYDNDVKAWACVIESDYPFAAETGVALSIYNEETYNIFEFTITAPAAGQYYAIITAIDDYTGYTTQVWKSEPFYFNDFDDTINIRYYADENQSKIDYRTGIYFDMCVPGRLTVGEPTGEDEMFEDDNGNQLLQKSVYVRGYEFESSMIPAWLAEKIVIATGHPTLEINGVKMVRLEKPDITYYKDENNPFCTVKITLQEIDSTGVSELIGIVSSPQYVLGVGGTEVLAI